MENQKQTRFGDDGKWHHVAHSIIPAKTVKTYIDGVQELGDFAAMAAKKSISSEDGRPTSLKNL